ncbi:MULTISPECIES: hypothetical protein [unclassified Enterococcus]|uniref:hypothetical protein n=1 Tax=unclassified Enterococcus TaxID=2608891 RepID=UPI001CE0BFD7|nr:MULTISPECIES: hypothetical protein [unclassified Enterococcus]MCA5013717.1 hypothetical protein [Enterococcus sp. S23]MCA5016967.1 hypothetical protein [Enterococcus sp. S22(2020)]
MKKKLGFILGIILLVVFFVAGKKYMDRKALEKSYQDGVELIQNYVTDYLVKNYEGIEKIEWQGVGVEWRSSPTLGASILGNYVDSDAKIFISKNDYFLMTFRLNDKAEYKDNSKKYFLKASLNANNIDSTLAMEIRNTTRRLAAEEKLIFQNIKKSNSGSPHVQITYNTAIHELSY